MCAGCARMLRAAANLTEAGVPLSVVLERAAPASGVPALVTSTRVAAERAAEGSSTADVWQSSGLPAFAWRPAPVQLAWLGYFATTGMPTVDYTETDKDIPLTGRIALQIHGGPPGEAWYRNIRIKELK